MSAQLINCPVCEQPVSSAAPACPKCAHPIAAPRYAAPAPASAPAVRSGPPVVYMPVASPVHRSTYIILGILLGYLGIHNFYAKRMGVGFVQLFICLLTGWILVPLFFLGVWSLIEICVVTQDGLGRAMD